MPFSRYSRAPVLALGSHLGTSEAIRVIREAVNDGRLKCRELDLHEKQRLDHIAGQVYGDARYWWILAAASGIGWGLQCPPGTIVLVPDLSDVAQLVG